MSISKKLLQSSAAAAAVCNSESIAPFGNEASYNKNVAIYQFEDNANDSSGNSNNGTAANVSYVTGKFGKAASFNGSSSTLEVTIQLFLMEQHPYPFGIILIAAQEQNIYLGQA